MDRLPGRVRRYIIEQVTSESYPKGYTKVSEAESGVETGGTIFKESTCKPSTRNAWHVPM